MSDFEIGEPRRRFGFFRGDADAQAGAREIAGSQVFGSVSRPRGTEHSQHQFRRRHPLVIATALGRLVTDDF